MRIMLIDDDKDLCHLTKMALAKQGYEVISSYDAAVGIKFAHTYKPNLILMDVVLPGINGGEAVRLLKADPQLKNIPVVFLTGLVSEHESDKKGLKVDGVNYPSLGKPFEIEQLLDIVQKYAK